VYTLIKHSIKVRGAKNQLDGKSGDVHLEHFDGVLQNVAKRNKDAAKMMEALQVPFHEVNKKKAGGGGDLTSNNQ
jgi:hypothetical protein